MGDVLMTTPAFRALKESLPSVHLTLLTSPAGAAVADLIPEVDETIVYAAPWMKSTASRAWDETDEALIERLRAGRFDAAIIFTVFSQNPLPAAMLAFMANIPLRLAHCRENPYLLLTDWLPEPEPDRLIRHEVRRQLDLVASVEYETATESLSLWVPPESQATAIAALEAAGVHPGDRFVVLHPGASAPSRRYPAKQFGAAAAALQRDAFPVVITGDTSEIELCEEVRQAAGTGSISLAGRLSL